MVYVPHFVRLYPKTKQRSFSPIMPGSEWIFCLISLAELFSFIISTAWDGHTQPVLRANLALSSCFSSLTFHISYDSASLISLTISSFKIQKQDKNSIINHAC